MKIPGFRNTLSGATLSAGLLISPAAFGQLTSVKLELYNHQVWFEAGIRGTGTDTLNFLFDSGAGTALLDSALAARLFEDRPFGQIDATGAGGTARMQVLDNQSINVGGLRIDSVNFLVKNLEDLSAMVGRHIDGIIGYDLLKKYVTRIDLDRRTLSLYGDIQNLKEEKGPPLAFKYSPEISFLPRISCSFTTLAGQHYTGWFFMDSGAGLTTLLNTPFVNAHHLLTTSGKTMQLKTVGMTGASDRYVARVKDFDFCGYVFTDVPVSLSQVSAGVSSMENYAGLLGNEFLFRFNMTFDYAHDAIYLQRNNYYAVPFDFPMCGFTVKLEHGNVYIAAIAPDAPEKAQGLSIGDQVIGVNGKTNFSIAQIRELLQQPGKIVLKVRQGNAEKTFEIRLYPRI
jgi:hypothetical protein